MNDLAAFIAWAKVAGHYHVVDMYANYLAFLKSQEESE